MFLWDYFLTVVNVFHEYNSANLLGKRIIINQPNKSRTQKQVQETHIKNQREVVNWQKVKMYKSIGHVQVAPSVTLGNVKQII